MDDTDINETLGRILAKVRVVPGNGTDPPCGVQRLAVYAMPGHTYCDAGVHYRATEKTTRPDVVGRCPFAVAAEVRECIDAERSRLAGALLLAGGGFDGYDTRRFKGALEACRAMQRFSSERPPVTGVVLSGETGLGKSRLLLASHFALLAAGVSTEYVTASSLRPVFRRMFSFDEAAAEESTRYVHRLANVQALHLDDIGDVRGSEAFHADFSAGLLSLLAARRGAIAVAFNLTAEQASRHPDIGDRVLSRLVDRAEIVRLDGEDQRKPSNGGDDE